MIHMDRYTLYFSDHLIHQQYLFSGCNISKSTSYLQKF
ncbi:hypothetical protein Y11_26091 [Yersinia enterocolitica subsp. palearctica Y11]|uniref:Uncharacterized protein n=1 Tax=Yersinia enterocolitica subsp. palearctica serotype O:3 (strain DSM 13030 / CIP 106945 / Y11) TaxID=930944 RepID=A0A0H3NXG0_YERE1|nr:hypothetical protein Y11_26091 [Yersinia enterocolitica subsp. palearctica Y11]CCO69945.1 hypothetical protein D322_3088 [Yersinia enterocolitica IP 10393]